MSVEEKLNVACRVCANDGGNRLHRAREMFFGTRRPFDYIECAACGTLQIGRVPDLGPHYPADYYSFRPADTAHDAPRSLPKRIARRLGRWARVRAADYYCSRRDPARARRHRLGRLFDARLPRVVTGFPPYLERAPLDLRIGRRSAVLDVGSGAGGALTDLGHFGFSDLTGVDPFVASDITYPNGVRVLKAELSALEGRYDLIIASHSVEHVPSPRRTLAEIFRLLKPDRYAVVRLPLAARAWREYGVNWVQLDAPRHLFLYPARTFQSLAEEAGFAVDEVAYDSTAFQFWGSEQYARDIPLLDERSYCVDPGRSIFRPAEIAHWEARCRILNREGRADAAGFVLTAARNGRPRSATRASP
jgi:SAM-dependent methyltransferase